MDISKLADGQYPAFLGQVTQAQLTQLAHAKRFVERYTGDPAFRALALQDPRGAAAQYDIRTDPEAIRALWDPEAARRQQARGRSPGELVDLCVRYDRAMVEWMMRRRASHHISDLRLRAWWQRQLARNDSEIGAPFNAKDVHAPACFELTQGCTVGCWFCAISAERFGGAFGYTPDNVRLWRETLAVVRDIVGPAAEVGFCYWATDPFDNPDYERLVQDYAEIIGSPPATTTAQPHKDIERTRRMLDMWRSQGFVYNRLSILTTGILDKVHRTFTAEELVWTGLELLNKQSTKKKAAAGRALEKIDQLTRQGEDASDWQQELTQGTIACVTGFLFNMVERRVKLISPCRADERWPKGYRVYDEGSFASGDELRALMQRMIADHMPMQPRGADRLRFRRDLQFRALSDGCELSNPFTRQNIQHPRYGRRLTGMIREGRHTVDEVVGQLAGDGVHRGDLLAALKVLFQAGLLDDEPVPADGVPVSFPAAR